MFRRIPVLSAGLESANVNRERYTYMTDPLEQKQTVSEVRCISLRFQFANTPESPDPTQAGQHGQSHSAQSQAQLQ